MEPGPREHELFGGAVLSAVAIMVLAGGGWWWVAAAPSPRAEGTASRLPRAEVTAFPSPGEVVPASPSSVSRVIIDGDAGEVLGLGADNALPHFPDTVRRGVTVLDGEDTFRWEVTTEDGARYLLQYVCVGQGQVLVSLPGESAVYLPTAGCGDGFTSAEVRAGGDRLIVRFWHPHDGRAEVAAQLLRLP